MAISKTGLAMVAGLSFAVLAGIYSLRYKEDSAQRLDLPPVYEKCERVELTDQTGKKVEENVDIKLKAQGNQAILGVYPNNFDNQSYGKQGIQTNQFTQINGRTTLYVIHPKRAFITDSQNGFFVPDYNWIELMDKDDNKAHKAMFWGGRQALGNILSNVPFSEEVLDLLKETVVTENREGNLEDLIKEGYTVTRIENKIARRLMGKIETAREYQIDFDVSQEDKGKFAYLWLRLALGDPTENLSGGAINRFGTFEKWLKLTLEEKLKEKTPDIIPITEVSKPKENPPYFHPLTNLGFLPPSDIRGQMSINGNRALIRIESNNPIERASEIYFIDSNNVELSLTGCWVKKSNQWKLINSDIEKAEIVFENETLQIKDGSLILSLRNFLPQMPNFEIIRRSLPEQTKPKIKVIKLPAIERGSNGIFYELSAQSNRVALEKGYLFTRFKSLTGENSEEGLGKILIAPLLPEYSSSSPDSRMFPTNSNDKMILWSKRTERDREIWVYDEKGEHGKPLIQIEGVEFMPSLSPDGKRFAFLHWDGLTQGSGVTKSIHIAKTDGTMLKEFPNQSCEGPIEWSKDGKTIYIIQEGKDGYYEVKIDSETGKEISKEKARDVIKLPGECYYGKVPKEINDPREIGRFED